MSSRLTWHFTFAIIISAVAFSAARGEAPSVGDHFTNQPGDALIHRLGDGPGFSVALPDASNDAVAKRWELSAPGKKAQREEIIFHMNGRRDPAEGKNSAIMSVVRSPMQIRCVRTPEWKYAEYFTAGREETEEELYNLADDPLEMDNLAVDSGYQGRKKELRGRLSELENNLERDFSS